MHSEDDDETFPLSDDLEAHVAGDGVPHWNILIVDDDLDVHQTTQFALLDKKIHRRPLHFISAHSAQGAIEILGRESNIDLVLMDAVMEHEYAGLAASCNLRMKLGRTELPIVIMRSGFAGLDVERNLSVLPCIDEFIHKTEGTREKLVNLFEKWLGAKRQSVCSNCSSSCKYWPEFN